MKNTHIINPEISAFIKETAPALKNLARQIHAHPETGYQERFACQQQVQMLKKWNFRITTPFAKLPTAYKAATGNGRPVFCFMSEYDALPEIGHACGHNLIAAAALGAGRALGAILQKEKIPGTVVVMGTPAEETKGGKVKMIQAGALKGLDAALMAHPDWRTEPDTGGTAVIRYNVNYHGKSAHAAASPELGLNALDAVMLLFQGVNAWRQQLPESSRVHGIVTHGGVAPNIIPEFASCFFYLRSFDDKELEQISKIFSNIVKGAALMTGTRFELETAFLPYRACLPNQCLNDASMEYASQLGLNPVVPSKPNCGSSDFGNVSQMIPAAHFYFGIARRQIAGHSTDMLKAAGSAYGLQQMLLAAETMANVGYRFFTDTPFRRNITEEFNRSKKGIKTND